eukprot:scaffold240903_cov55-Prasinocladus_malaysianus.AAC.1
MNAGVHKLRCRLGLAATCLNVPCHVCKHHLETDREAHGTIGVWKEGHSMGVPLPRGIRWVDMPAEEMQHGVDCLIQLGLQPFARHSHGRPESTSRHILHICCLCANTYRHTEPSTFAHLLLLVSSCRVTTGMSGSDE